MTGANTFNMIKVRIAIVCIIIRLVRSSCFGVLVELTIFWYSDSCTIFRPQQIRWTCSQLLGMGMSL
jgi:hypothetical protein